ncbi:MAG: hypothetical protein A2W61_04110 [Deltaproteobacteria bacterium RIFCSPLOWO2_01_44_7]|nr:MAG: hypothetical protein A2W61_04110 [Deltaproteobacteria bacterium RIFCSPLOWO2_01_44_7]
MTKIHLQCEEPIWVEQFHQMLKGGISEKEIDRGYYLLRRKENPKLSEASMERYRIGSGDGVIECAEVAEATVDHYSQYHDFLRKITGRVVPWMIEDEHKATEYLQKIDRTVAVLKSAIKRQGFPPDSEEYQRRLFIGLSSFASAPPKKQLELLQKRDPHFFRTLFFFLFEEGLGDFADYIIKKGGLGLGFTRKDFPMEGTLLEALQQPLGLCTERSRVFFFVLKRAGLNPVFVHLTGQDHLSFWKRQRLEREFGGVLQPNQPFKEIRMGHVTIALPLPSQKIYVDFFKMGGVQLLIASNSMNNFATDLTLREMLQADLSNLAVDSVDVGAYDQGAQALRGGLLLQESSHSNLLDFNLAYLAMRRHDRGELSKRVRKLISEVSDLLPKPEWLFALPKERELWAAAKERWLKFAEKEPVGHAQLAGIYFKEGQFDKTLEQSDKAIANGFKDSSLYSRIGFIEETRGNLLAAENAFRESLLLNPRDASIQSAMGMLLKRQGKYVEAKETFLKGVALEEPGSVRCLKILWQIASVAYALGEKEEADAYMQLIRKQSLFLKDLSAGVILIQALWDTGSRQEALETMEEVTQFVRSSILDNLREMDPKNIDPGVIHRVDSAISFLGIEMLKIDSKTYKEFYSALSRYYAAIGELQASQEATKRAEQF